VTMDTLSVVSPCICTHEQTLHAAAFPDTQRQTKDMISGRCNA